MAQPIPLEDAVVTRVKKYGKARGVYWVMKTAGQGLPDLIGIYRGLFLGVEVKRPHDPSGKNHYGVTELQKYRLQQIRQAGGVGIVARHQDDLLSMLDVVDELCRRGHTLCASHQPEIA